MNICLKTYAKQKGSQHVVITLRSRLPERIHSPCELTCDFQVADCGNYYALTLAVASELTVSCQRCLGEFHQSYSHQTELAVCATDAIAETLMTQFECIVASDYQVDLTDILTDELYLSAPDKHANFAECDSEISRLIRPESEIVATTLGLATKTR